MNLESEAASQFRAAALARSLAVHSVRSAFISALSPRIRGATPLYFFVVPLRQHAVVDRASGARRILTPAAVSLINHKRLMIRSCDQLGVKLFIHLVSSRISLRLRRRDALQELEFAPTRVEMRGFVSRRFD